MRIMNIGLVTGAFLLLSSPSAFAAPYPTIAQDVGVCDPNAPTHCAKPDASGNLPVTGSFSPSGTQDINLKQVGGVSTDIGTGSSGSGTQRVTTSTDSTISSITNPAGIKGADGSSIASNTNPVPISDSGTSLTVDCAGAACATAAKQDILSAQFPTTLGAKTGANSLSVVPASDGFPVQVPSPATAGATISFRQTATASAAALPTNTLTNGMFCGVMGTNTGIIYVGGSGVTTSNGFPLAVGGPFSGIQLGGNNSNLSYIIGSNLTNVLVCVGN